MFKFCTFDDSDETWFERSSSYQKSVNVLYLNQFVTVFLAYTASVNNSAVCCFLVNSLQILSDPVVNLVNLFSCGSLSCSDCPNWFISQNNILPICNLVFNSIKLPLNDFNCFVLFSFSKSFTKAENDFQSKFQRILNFFSNNCISFSEVSSSFRVSQNDPLDVNIMKLFRSNFSCVGSETVH